MTLTRPLCLCDVCLMLRHVRERTSHTHPHRQRVTLYERSHNSGQAAYEAVARWLHKITWRRR